MTLPNAPPPLTKLAQLHALTMRAKDADRIEDTALFLIVRDYNTSSSVLVLQWRGQVLEGGHLTKWSRRSYALVSDMNRVAQHVAHYLSEGKQFNVINLSRQNPNLKRITEVETSKKGEKVYTVSKSTSNKKYRRVDP